MILLAIDSSELSLWFGKRGIVLYRSSVRGSAGQPLIALVPLAIDSGELWLWLEGVG